MAASSSSSCRDGGRTNTTCTPYFSASDSCSGFAASIGLTFGCKYGAAAIAMASRRLASALVSRITDTM